MPPLDSGTGAVEAKESSTRMAPKHLSDMLIAETIVHDIRLVPGVLDMGEGLFAKVGTYGPRKHIPGIVIHHPTEDSFSVEVHVVLVDAAFTKAFSEISASEAPSRADSTPVLLRFTDQVRTAVVQTFEQLGLPVSSLVDVTIEDIR